MKQVLCLRYKGDQTFNELLACRDSVVVECIWVSACGLERNIVIRQVQRLDIRVVLFDGLNERRQLVRTQMQGLQVEILNLPDVSERGHEALEKLRIVHVIVTDPERCYMAHT